jgi:hypothetical protein
MPGEQATGLDLQYDGSKTQSQRYDAVQHIESCGNPRTVPSSICVVTFRCPTGMKLLLRHD